MEELPYASGDADASTMRPRVIWTTHGGELIRCAPQQLRPASALERFSHEMKYPAGINREFGDFRKDLKRHQWTDITAEAPLDNDEDMEDTPTRGILTAASRHALAMYLLFPTWR